VTRKWLLPKGDENDFTPVNWPGFGHDLLVTGNDEFDVRVLDVARPGRSLLADSSLIRVPKAPHGWWVNFLFRLLPDEKTLLAGYVTWPGKTTTARIVEISASTGRVRRVLHVFAHVPNPSGGMPLCYAESLGPSEVRALLWCINRFGRLDGSHFSPLPGAPKYITDYQAAW
jgi:hypothetical protein